LHFASRKKWGDILRPSAAGDGRILTFPKIGVQMLDMQSNNPLSVSVMNRFCCDTRSFLSFVLLLAIFSPVREAESADLTAVQLPGLPNFVTNDLLVSTAAMESIGAMDMWLRLGSGTIFEHPNGANVPSDPFLVGIDPTLAFDSFLGGGFSPVIVGASQELGSPNSGGPAIFNATTYDVRWAPQLGLNTANVTNLQIARLTLSNDANGFLSFALQTSLAFGDLRAEYVIANGLIIPVPEPSAAVLASVAMLALATIHRRRACPRLPVGLP
jgi:hypothetical protein